MPAPIRVDESCWPIVLTVFTGRQQSEDVDAYVERMDAIQGRGERYIGLSFMLRYRSSAEQLKKVGAWMKRTDAVTKELCVCNAIVAPSAGFRFLISGLMLITPMPVPFEIVADEGAAADWVEAFLGDHALTPPLGMRRYLEKQMVRSRADLAADDAAAR